MRTAVITTSYPRTADDAAGHFVQSAARALAEAGQEVTVFAPHPAPHVCFGNPTVHWLYGGDAFGSPGLLPRLRARPWRALWLPVFGWQLRRAVRAGDFDRLIAHWLVPTAWPLLQGMNLPLQVVVHGSDVACLLQLPRPAARAILRQLLARDAQFSCVSERLLEQLCELDARILTRASCEPAPLDIPPLQKENARERLGLDERTFLALSVGRLVASKRVDVALRSAPVPAGCRWVVIGDGPERASLARAFPAVEFLGQRPRPETLLWMAAADVLVCASLSEGSPCVIREARALGTPVWTSAVGDVESWARSDPGIRVLAQLTEKQS